MNKEEFVKSLEKVKLIIGNGFDLHCGLHTKYSDFYCKNFKRYLFIQNLYSEYEKSNEVSFNFEDQKIARLNVWDIFFALNSSKNPFDCKNRWCDIERLILSSLLDIDSSKTDIKKIAISLASNVHWETIKDCILNNRNATNHLDRFVVKFCSEKMNLNNINHADFYSFLLNELNEFEKDFGNFIYSQIHNTWLEKCNYGEIFLNKTFVQMAKDTINKVCTEQNIVGIDTFNYSYIHDEELLQITQHINGSVKNPIFGVDTIFEPNDERFIFTKTSRRIDSDFINNSIDEKPDFENIIIFGHSLDEEDYSYYFPVFDKLDLTNPLSSHIVVFAYSIFDESRKHEIKSNLRQSISNLLYAYAKSKNLREPNRFLDSLSTQKRIIVYEIPKIDKKLYPTDFNEIEWENIYKEVDYTKR